jgi:hypothetical protein
MTIDHSNARKKKRKEKMKNAQTKWYAQQAYLWKTITLSCKLHDA